MAKRTVSFKDYKEPDFEEYTGEDPPPNRWFTADAKRGWYDEEKDQIVVIFEISEGDFKGWGKGWYGPLDGEQKWKSQVLVKALQGGVKKDLTLDWDNEKAVETWLRTKAKPVKIKTRLWNDTISIGRLAPLMEAVGAPGKAAPAPAPEPEEVEDDEAIEDYTDDELSDMEIGDLEEILTEEFEAELPKKMRNAAAYKKKVIDAILEAQAESDEEEPEDEAEEDEEFEDGFEDEEEEEEEPEPEPAPRARRSRAAKAAPAPAKAAPAARRRRG